MLTQVGRLGEGLRATPLHDAFIGPEQLHFGATV
jgi:hypothetical protein